MSTASAELEQIEFYDYHPEPADFYAEVIEGLQEQQKSIPPKFFYDEAGSILFDKICELPEYYPTRTERKILTAHANEIAELIGHNCLLLEPGSGSCEKVRLLLDDLKPHAYVPMDISREYLRQSAQSISQDYPWLDVYAACIDFTQPIDLSFCPQDAQRIAFFPGSSIGNFEPSDARAFMQHVANTVGANGGMLIGVDLKKDNKILNSAYNDNSGVTAKFNLNLLTRINRELDADFDVNCFEHQAFYNESRGRIEMHLVSQAEQVVNIRNNKIKLARGESIHTENSYKYTVPEFQELASQAGFKPVYVWTDPDALFSVHYFTVTD